MVNVAAVVDLTHMFLPAMLQRGHGAVINVASTAGLQPLPHMAIYGATKAFVISFSEALRQEVKGHGVNVVGVCPGATETEFFEVAGEQAAVGRKAPPKDVVDTALRALENRRGIVIVGGANRINALAAKLLPRAFVARVTGRLLRGGPVTDSSAAA